MGRLPAASLLSVLLSVLVLGGCGGSSSSGDDAGAQITAPAYNGYPAITIPVETGTPARCRHEARAFSREAVSFLAPFPSDSDTHLVIARLQFYEFKAHQCDLDILRDAFSAVPSDERGRLFSQHWTPLGHQVAAAAIHEAIRREGLLGAD